MDYYEPRLSCGATQIGRFRRLLGQDGIEQLLKATIECAVDIKAVKPADLERVLVDSTVQYKAIVAADNYLERRVASRRNVTCRLGTCSRGTPMMGGRRRWLLRRRLHTCPASPPDFNQSVPQLGYRVEVTSSAGLCWR